VRAASTARSTRQWLSDGEVQWQPRSLPLSEHAARWRAQHLRDLARARARRRRAVALLAVSVLGMLSIAAGVQAGVLGGEPELRPIAVPKSQGPATSGGWESHPDSSDVPVVLREIARCESRGNPTAVSADGVYRGKYQFDQATWMALGGTGDPAAAPEHVQDRLAVRLYQRRGDAPWPVCRA
jgi:hypothetical protein